MAVALVQKSAAVSTAIPPAPTWPGAVGAGNLLVCMVRDSGNAVSTASTGWAQAFAGAGASNSQIFYRANSVAAEAAPTFSGTDGGGAPAAALLEFSGVLTASPLDQTATTSSITSPITPTAASADAQTGELIIIIGSDFSTKALTTTLTVSMGNGGSGTSAYTNQSVSAAGHYQMSYLLATTSNASADVCTVATNSMSLQLVTGCFASFKIPAAAATFQPRPPAINFQDPGLLMEGLGAKWEKARDRIWLPNFGGLPAAA